jgi:diphosphomevalonate decarboxylase
MSKRVAKASAHPNIALAKYWGKRDFGHNLPAVPSLSVTLAGMTTTTEVSFDDALADDVFVLGGEEAPAPAKKRVVGMLDRVRALAGFTSRARVTSDNDFPTSAGLASSASAFAALALAASRAAGLTLSNDAVSDLARKTSVSAARSVLGGFVSLRAGVVGDEVLPAVAFAPPSALALRVVVAVTREGPKGTLSTEGMLHTQRTSPYYAPWIEDAPGVYARVGAAILAGDFEALGVAAEESALRMHAAAIAAAPSLVYWTGGTVEVIAAVRQMRAKGLSAYATIDAGPHVKVLTLEADEARVTEAVRAVPGVLRVLVARPGEGAEIVA